MLSGANMSLCACDSPHLDIQKCAGPVCATLQSLTRSQRRAQVPLCLSVTARPRCHKPLGCRGFCNSAAAKRESSGRLCSVGVSSPETHNGWSLTTTVTNELSRSGFQSPDSQDHVGPVGKIAIERCVFSAELMETQQRFTSGDRCVHNTLPPSACNPCVI